MQHASCSPSESLSQAVIAGPNLSAVLPREEKGKVKINCLGMILPV